MAVVIGIAALMIGILARPERPSLSTQTSGDPALVEQVRSELAAQPGVRDRLSVALIDGNTVRWAHFGAAANTEYEIGSLTKTVTGMLLADSIERGEVRADTRLGELLDLGTSGVAAVTLEELATHRSGLPRLAISLGQVVPNLIAQWRATDPYQATVEELVAQARSTQLGPREFAYSNFGMALLGQALAAAAGTTYQDLVTVRVLAPLGMTNSYLPITKDGLRPDAPTGFTKSGRHSDAWTLQATAPAGGIRSTPADLVSYARAILDDEAPGTAALKPRADAGEVGRIGFAWLTDASGVTWHNGMTGGYASFLGLDQESGRAVVILSSTAVSVDDLGFTLLGVSR